MHPVLFQKLKGHTLYSEGNKFWKGSLEPDFRNINGQAKRFRFYLRRSGEPLNYLSRKGHTLEIYFGKVGLTLQEHEARLSSGLFWKRWEGCVIYSPSAHLLSTWVLTYYGS